MDVFPFEPLHEEHRRIAAEAETRGFTLRLLGALAFHLRCPNYVSLRRDLGRELSDLDHMVLSEHRQAIITVLEHPVTPTDAGINAQYIAQRLAGDWGFYYTVVNNLRRIRDKFLEQCPQLSAQERQQLRDRIDQLPDHMEAEPKTLKWKARARIGT